MGFSNSSLVGYTKFSNITYGKRSTLERITPHCTAGRISAITLGEMWSNGRYNASSNYGIGEDGMIGLYVPEDTAACTTSSMDNDRKAITIECSSERYSPYEMNSDVFDSLIKLCVDICRRNGKNKLLWLGTKTKTLNYKPKDDELVITAHRWFKNKECPGDWLYSRLGDLANMVTDQLQDKQSKADDYSLIFDASFYRGAYADVANDNDLYALFNFLDHMDDGRQGSFWFNPVFYKAKYKDLQDAFGDNMKTYYEHYMRFGFIEGRMPISGLPLVFDTEYYKNKYKDLQDAFGDNDNMYLVHFMVYGMHEGRQATATFNPEVYRLRYSDLNKAFGDNYKSYYRHFIEYGYIEGRKGI